MRDRCWGNPFGLGACRQTVEDRVLTLPTAKEGTAPRLRRPLQTSASVIGTKIDERRPNPSFRPPSPESSSPAAATDHAATENPAPIFHPLVCRSQPASVVGTKIDERRPNPSFRPPSRDSCPAGTVPPSSSPAAARTMRQPRTRRPFFIPWCAGRNRHERLL